MEGVICVLCVLFTTREVENGRGKLTKVDSFVQTQILKEQLVKPNRSAT